MGIIGLWGIARASNGDIYVADSFRILQVFEGSPPVVYAGDISSGNQNGDLLTARFASLGAMAIAPNGDLFVCDSDMVRRISGNTVSTFATLSPSRLHGIAVDSGGNVGITIGSADNIYVTDKNRILKFTPAGSMSVVAGSTAFGSVNAVGEAASFYSPSALAVGSDGDLYVADGGNSYIRKISLTTREVTTYAGTCYSGSITSEISSSAAFIYPSAIVAAADDVFYGVDGGTLRPHAWKIYTLP
ncbi:hypothetical protein PHYSODRAFT_256531 [Phytophthora sojae]|uniref:SMP-30/Gluconolactonase/LRE-like region domain-containing protein n=1 Tax=Phytophthora sojae (strain P6497) TaxID=1094619 RepID=G4Z2P3_PHYSP|nr:hypothetical protein PHYSODRAFT_256531 [Phytophthora sojae]EGZ21472.1 hypothetical protein PHYSODRAFT_256531 [Phytophthora sojae]|eukprot:XP_009524189.1 hypothetical protein PHYSODRAFT_256531 [Phytophthora sojae]